MQGVAALLGERRQCLHAVEALALDRAAREPRPLRRWLSLAVLAREEPTREREVRDVRHSELATEREDVGVIAALEEAVVVLEHREARGPVLAPDSIRLRQ